MKLNWFSWKVADISSMNDYARTANIKKQVGFSIIFKVLAILFNFLLVPFTLKYLGSEQYGVWITILTVLSWISFFDMGLGNGMRNRIAEALARRDYLTVRQVVSSTYVAVGVIVLSAYVIFFGVSWLINWQHVFNVTSISNKQLNIVMLFCSFVLFLDFLLSLVNQVLNAYQQSSLAGISQIITNGCGLMLMYILLHITKGSLLLVAFSYGGASILAKIIVSWRFFSKQREARPSFCYYKWKIVRSITGLSLSFFIIQLAAMVFFAKDNVIIVQVLGPEYVTKYSLVVKIFSIVTFGQGIVLAPLWSAYTDAYAKGDVKWMRNTMRKMNLLMLPVIAGIIILCLISPVILRYWVGNSGIVKTSLVWLIGLYTIVSVWNNNFASFINGTGKLRLSLLVAPIITVVNIPLSIFMAHHYGLDGMVIATIICLLPIAILSPVQYKMILNSTEKKGKLYCIFCK
jgi:O-antigen/teichoic acid export membrane protein